MNDDEKRIKKFLDKYFMKDKGKFFKKERWVSFCSSHQTYNKECKLCNSGSWKNVWILNISNFLYRKSPTIWGWFIKILK